MGKEKNVIISRKLNNVQKNFVKYTKEKGGELEWVPNSYKVIVDTKGMMMKSKAPEWFTNWTTSFEKKNDGRWDRQEEFNNNQLEFNKNQLEFNKNQLEFNKLLLSLPTIKKEIESLKRNK